MSQKGNQLLIGTVKSLGMNNLFGHLLPKHSAGMWKCALRADDGFGGSMGSEAVTPEIRRAMPLPAFKANTAYGVMTG